MTENISLIVAVGKYIEGKGFPIGKSNSIPWHNTEDFKLFKRLTTKNAVIMGRKTYESIGHPLKNRLNIVITSAPYNYTSRDNLYFVDSLENAIKLAKYHKKYDMFIIGGSSIYNEALVKGLISTMYITYIDKEVDDADTFFSEFSYYDGWITVDSKRLDDNATSFVYRKLTGDDNEVDSKYINLAKDICYNGSEKDTRAGKTKSIFGTHLEFNLEKGLPMLTTKKMFSKGCIHELLWFISGNTNIKYLIDNNVHIWDDDAYRYYLSLVEKHNSIIEKETKMDWISYKREPIVPVSSKEEFIEKVKNGDKQWICVDEKAYIMSYTPNCWEYEYQYGDLGPVYGAQWTQWGGNQIHKIIDTLKTNPDDRRMLISAWNVASIDTMALPPCHYSCQFYAEDMTKYERYNWYYNRNHNGKLIPSEEEMDNAGVPRKKLSCLWNQRSVDTLLGLPFNILSYAVFTHLIAQCAGMAVGKLIFNGGDTHIYLNQIATFKKEQMLNSPNKFALPMLKLNPNIKNIDDFKYEDIRISEYKSFDKIKYPLSVGL